MPGSSKKSYVRVPLSPDYLLAILAAMESQNKGKTPPLIYPTTLTYSNAEIANIIPATGKTAPQVAKDLPRTTWKLASDAQTGQDIHFATHINYNTTLISENGTVEEDHLYIKWDAAFQTLRYKVLNSQKAVKEDVIPKDTLEKQLGTQRYDTFIGSLAILNSQEFLQNNAITKENITTLLGENECTNFITSYRLNENEQKFFLLGEEVKRKLLVTVLDPFTEDLLRITSQAGNTSPPRPDSAIQEMVLTSREPESGLNLTADEARALLAFRCTLNKNDIVQGGVFAFPQTSIHLWLEKILPHPPVRTVSHQVIRNKQNQLEVIYTYHSSFNLDNNYQDPDLFIYSNRYLLQKDEDGFTLTRVENGENNRVALFEENFFNKIVIPKVLNQLNIATFNEEDLFLFIPFLSNKAFAQAFIQKFMQQPIFFAKTINFLNSQFSRCFGISIVIINSFWDRHGAKITLPIMSLILATIIVTAVVVTLGFPVVVSALGGVLFFGLAAAAVGVVASVIGGLVGNKIDTDYLRSCVLNSIKIGQSEWGKGATVGLEVMDKEVVTNISNSALLPATKNNNLSDDEDDKSEEDQTKDTTPLGNLKQGGSEESSASDSDSDNLQARRKASRSFSNGSSSEITVPEGQNSGDATSPRNPNNSETLGSSPVLSQNNHSKNKSPPPSSNSSKKIDDKINFPTSTPGLGHNNNLKEDS